MTPSATQNGTLPNYYCWADWYWWDSSVPESHPIFNGYRIQQNNSDYGIATSFQMGKWSLGANIIGTQYPDYQQIQHYSLVTEAGYLGKHADFGVSLNNGWNADYFVLGRTSGRYLFIGNIHDSNRYFTVCAELSEDGLFGKYYGATCRAGLNLPLFISGLNAKAGFSYEDRYYVKETSVGISFSRAPGSIEYAVKDSNLESVTHMFAITLNLGMWHSRAEM